MNTGTPNYNYFSIRFNLVGVDTPLFYDLFVNSSGVDNRLHFVRIVSRGTTLSVQDRAMLQKRYLQLYVPEDQRAEYMLSIVGIPNHSSVEKATVLKDSAIHYLDKLFDKDKEFSTEMLAETINDSREVVSRMVDVIHDYNVDQLQEMIANLSFHDFYTFDHSINVSMYSILIFKFVNPSATREEVIHAGLGGLLHDLGKIKIPTNILNKPEKLTTEEFKQIMQHPKFGYDFLHAPKLKLSPEIDPNLISRVIYEHHENVDGSGYPKGLKGEEIHQLARITAIADFFDALTTKRAYAKPLSTPEALALMSRSVDKKIDAQIFEIFAKQTKKYEANRMESKLELPSSFDPCQPHNRLPIKMINFLAPTLEAERENAEKVKAFGKIKIVGNEEEIKTWDNLKKNKAS